MASCSTAHAREEMAIVGRRHHFIPRFYITGLMAGTELGASVVHRTGAAMLDQEAFQRTFAHAMELWFEPEIRRRQESGTAPKPFPLRGLQVILYADGRPDEVRLNEEVHAVGEMRLKDGVTKRPGDPVCLNELEEFPLIRLPDSEDPNCGHFTLFLLGGRWYGNFDFRYNRGKASELLTAAEEFLATASDALERGRTRAAIDNLFSAAELAAKAYIITTPLPGDGDLRRHGRIHARFNMFAQHGNVDAEHRRTFNALSQVRTRARYVSGPVAVAPHELARWRSDVEELVQTVGSRVH